MALFPCEVVAFIKDTQPALWQEMEALQGEIVTNKLITTKHLRNIFESKELEEKSNVQKMHIAHSDKPVAFYNLDAIISVGYRVNSKQGTQFRIWATNVLRKHLVDGYTINEKRLKAAAHKYQELQKSLQLLGNVIRLESISDEAKGLIQITTEYSRALDILDDFDHERLSVPKGTKQEKESMIKVILNLCLGNFKVCCIAYQTTP